MQNKAQSQAKRARKKQYQ